MDPAFREAVIRRDGSCQAAYVGFARHVRCGGALHAHHRVLVTKVDELWNVTTVCLAHHDFIHSHPAYARCFGLVIPRSWQVDDPDAVLVDLTRRLVDFRRGFDEAPPLAPWVTLRDLAAAREFDLRWDSPVPL